MDSGFRRSFALIYTAIRGQSTELDSGFTRVGDSSSFPARCKIDGSRDPEVQRSLVELHVGLRLHFIMQHEVAA